MKQFSIYLIFMGLLFSACKKNKVDQKAVAAANGETYFSIRQFAKDQFNTYWEQPFSFQQIIKNNEHADTTIVTTSQVNWEEILAPFFAADIGKTDLVGQYDFTIINEDATVSKIYHYQAKNPELHTQQFQVVTDPFNDRIKSIYIEAKEKNWWKEKSEKLYYAPLKVIQIQTFESNLIGKNEQKLLEYRFMN